MARSISSMEASREEARREQQIIGDDDDDHDGDEDDYDHDDDDDNECDAN